MDLLDLAMTLNQESGGPKQVLEGIYSLNCSTRQKLYKTKVVHQSCFSGGRSFQKELAMHRLTFDPGQRRVLLLVSDKI